MEQALVADHGIDASRLEANGVGPLAPVSNNTGDAGRALDVTEVSLLSIDALGMTLTDDHAPVESLLAPVVRKRADGGLRSRR